MNVSLVSNQARTVGQFPLHVAFGVARDLEHAGITALVVARNGEYHVQVDPSRYDQAMRRI